jgi:exodeoxyribonuclease V alpha subunit
MTVHKSQGSEFDRVIVVLPDRDSPLLTRELVYTAVTRGRRQVTVLGSETTLRTAIERTAERVSGLRDRLASPRRLLRSSLDQ